MSYFLELKEAFITNSNGDIKEGLELVSSILEDIKADGLEGYERELKEEAIDNNLCPNCFGNLRVTELGEDITEAWGRLETTPIRALICEECGELIE